MQTRHPVFLLLAISLVLTSQAWAQPRAGDCVIGPGLAATLLFPYFEVDMASPYDLTTLFSVNNGLSAPALARVVLWTDWGIPTLAFDVYLRGFDILPINVRDIFLFGSVPSTGESADLSGFPFCAALEPYHANPVLTEMEREQLVAFHTGVAGPMLPGLCAGESHGNEVVRGYLTVDVVDECSGVEAVEPIFTPANTTYPYFVDGGSAAGIAIADNTLWGEILYVDTPAAAAQGLGVIPIWSDSGLFAGTNIFTFYGRFSGWDGRDDRVPLPYRWDQRFLNGGPFSGGASFIVWRDVADPAASPIPCGTTPPWYPLSATSGALNEDGGAYEPILPDHIRLATQRVDVTSLGIPYSFGWVQFDTHVSQSWVQATLSGSGLFSAAADGTPVEFLCNRTPP